jgi:hypothetical protein
VAMVFKIHCCFHSPSDCIANKLKSLQRGSQFSTLFDVIDDGKGYKLLAGSCFEAAMSVTVTVVVYDQFIRVVF